ncbi:MAG: TerB family tellurite resistance protein [Bacteroidota bacterium]
MAKFVKWIGAGLGWAFGGPIGAILGYALGSAFHGMSQNDIEDFQKSREGYTGTQSGDFEVSLLVLSAAVIKADGKTTQPELDFVRNHFVQMYGKERANQAFRLFKEIINNQNISIRQVSMQIAHHMDHASRLQLLHFLFGIAKADGHVSKDEVHTIKTISGYLYISPQDFGSIKAMFYDDTENAYKILEVTKASSDDDVKKAYRRMARKYHPDRVHHLGEEHMQGAKEKFQKVQEAYEKIKNERGFS